MTENDIKKEYLGNNISVFCSKTHRFGTDAVLLEFFALNGKTPPKKIMDFGCGCGIIPMLYARDLPNADITALDIQGDAIELVNMAIEHNSVSKRVHALNCDLKNISTDYFGQFDLVSMNPPYKRKGAGLMTENEGLNIARFELECTFNDIVISAKKLLKTGGRLCVCNRPNRLADMICAMRENGIEPKRMQTVSQRMGFEPMLVLLEGVVGANANITILPPLYLEDENGKLSEQAQKIYAKWEYDRKNI